VQFSRKRVFRDLHFCVWEFNTFVYLRKYSLGQRTVLWSPVNELCVCCHRVPSELPAISLFDLQGTVRETYVSCLAISCLVFYRHSYGFSAHVCEPRLSLRVLEDTERWLPCEHRLQKYL